VTKEPYAMPIAADYPFLDVLWTMILFFTWVAWIWILIVIFTDLFRRRDVSGWGKAAWVVFLIVLPFLGALVYLIAQHDGMAQRQADAARGQKAEMDEYVRSVAGSGGGPAAEIDKAKQLLDSGAINQTEFDALKAKALAS
jgi:general stress protein CsbA